MIIRKNYQFKKVYDRGKKIYGKWIIIFYCKSSIPGKIVGFSTSKVIKRSVDRNRARRLMKEFFRINQQKIKDGMEYVFLCRRSMENLKYRDLEAEGIYLLKREGLLK